MVGMIISQKENTTKAELWEFPKFSVEIGVKMVARVICVATAQTAYY